ASIRSLPPPHTRSEPVVESCHGIGVADPYRWLEDDSPEVAAWTDAQDRYTREVLDAQPGRDRLRSRLQQLFAIGTLSPPTQRGGRYFYERRAGAQEQPVLLVREGLNGPERTLLDPAALSADGASALDWYYPSPDGALLAYGVSEGGSEKSTLRIRRVDGGDDLQEAIPWTRACSLEWLPDG